MGETIYPKTDLGKSCGYYWAMYWCFRSTGTEIVTGSHDLFNKHTDKWDSFHAMMHVYRDGIIDFRRWTLGGRGISWMSEGPKLELMRWAKTSTIGICNSEAEAKLRKVVNPHHTHILIRHNRSKRMYGDVDLLGSWRKLPQQYLRQLADAL